MAASSIPGVLATIWRAIPRAMKPAPTMATRIGWFASRRRSSTRSTSITGSTRSLPPYVLQALHRPPVSAHSASTARHRSYQREKPGHGKHQRIAAHGSREQAPADGCLSFPDNGIGNDRHSGAPVPPAGAHRHRSLELAAVFLEKALLGPFHLSDGLERGPVLALLDARAGKLDGPRLGVHSAGGEGLIDVADLPPEGDSQKESGICGCSVTLVEDEVLHRAPAHDHGRKASTVPAREHPIDVDRARLYLFDGALKPVDVLLKRLSLAVDQIECRVHQPDTRMLVQEPHLRLEVACEHQIVVGQDGNVRSGSETQAPSEVSPQSDVLPEW